MAGWRIAAGSVVTMLLVAACTSPPPTLSPAETAQHPTAAPTSPTGIAESTTSGATASAPPPRTSVKPTTQVDPASIQALIKAHYYGHGLRLGREGGSTPAYRQYYATYEGDGLTISGRINIPRGAGPFPAVVLAHGYVDPARYTNGQTMLRERDFLARQGYVTLHIDYRNHAQSGRDPADGANLRVGYTKDAINAGLALQQLSFVDPDRLAIVGRSMGGGVVYNAIVARPDLFRAAVAYSPVSSDTADNFNRWVRPDAGESSVALEVLERLGAPEDEPTTWATVSPRTYFDRVRTPLLIHHGTADEECPIAWSEETVAALEAAGKDVIYRVYRGERHTFTTQWPLSIRRTAAFLAEHLG
jgi:dipeptidyl aminopeptidase/acylaminoacyl peptidase